MAKIPVTFDIGAARRPIRRVPEPNAAILLVDDDAAVRVGLRRVLETEGWTVATAGSGEDALSQLAVCKPRLLITDLKMAAVSGWDLLFHENLQRPNMPIFIITALPRGAAGGAERLAAEYFQKPLDLEALLSAVRRHLSPNSKP